MCSPLLYLLLGALAEAQSNYQLGTSQGLSIGKFVSADPSHSAHKAAAARLTSTDQPRDVLLEAEQGFKAGRKADREWITGRQETLQGTEASANAQEPLDQLKSHWLERKGNAVSAPGGKRRAEPPAQLELVICRNNQQLDWVADIPFFWQVTILNRGARDSQLPRLPRGRRWGVISMRRVSSDSQALAQFLVMRYHQLADYTVFSPENPLAINGWFLHLLQHPTKLNNVQALSGIHSKDGNSTKIDRISTRTLNSVLLHNADSIDAAKWFAKDYGLGWGANILKMYFEMIGLINWMDERQEVGSYAPGALLGVERSRVQRHPKNVYESLLRTSTEFGGNPLVIERLWLMLFGGADFKDSALVNSA